jgi:hypothetical protein
MTSPDPTMNAQHKRIAGEHCATVGGLTLAVIHPRMAKPSPRLNP